MAVKEAIKTKEIVFDFITIDKGIADFYADDVGKEYVIVDNKITFLYIALTPLPDPTDLNLIPPLRFGSFFRHNILSYREKDWGVDEYNELFVFLDIIPDLIDFY